MSRKVIIQVFGGVAEVIQKSVGVEVEIHDYDVLCDECGQPGGIRTDSDGDQYWLSIYSAEEEI